MSRGTVPSAWLYQINDYFKINFLIFSLNIIRLVLNVYSTNMVIKQCYTPFYAIFVIKKKCNTVGLDHFVWMYYAVSPTDIFHRSCHWCISQILRSQLPSAVLWFLPPSHSTLYRPCHVNVPSGYVTFRVLQRLGQPFSNLTETPETFHNFCCSPEPTHLTQIV